MSRRRWVVPLAAVVLVALLVFGLRSYMADGNRGVPRLKAALLTDLRTWDALVGRHEPFAGDLLRPLAEKTGAPLPALRADPREPGEGDLTAIRDLAELGRASVESSAAAGRMSEAVRLAIALIRYGEDARRERGFDVEFYPTVEAGESAMRGLARDEKLSGAALLQAIEFERARLKERPSPDQAWRYRYLEAQGILDLLRQGKGLSIEVDWGGPIRTMLGLARSEPDERDYLDAWSGLIREFRSLIDSAESGDEDRIRYGAERLRGACAEEKGTIFARLAGSLLVYGNLARDNYESWLRTREARLFGMLMLRYRAEHGAFPEDLESIRVEEIPKSPHGGTWRLGVDRETKKPAVFLDGGRVYSYQILAPREGDFHSDRETRPLFSFR